MLLKIRKLFFGLRTENSREKRTNRIVALVFHSLNRIVQIAISYEYFLSFDGKNHKYLNKSNKPHILIEEKDKK